MKEHYTTKIKMKMFKKKKVYICMIMWRMKGGWILVMLLMGGFVIFVLDPCKPTLDFLGSTRSCCLCLGSHCTWTSLLRCRWFLRIFRQGIPLIRPWCSIWVIVIVSQLHRHLSMRKKTWKKLRRLLREWGNMKYKIFTVTKIYEIFFFCQEIYENCMSLCLSLGFSCWRRCFDF